MTNKFVLNGKAKSGHPESPTILAAAHISHRARVSPGSVFDLISSGPLWEAWWFS